MSDEIRPSEAPAHDTDWEALTRLVAGESDAVESAAVSAWLATHPRDAALVALVKTHTDQVAGRSAEQVDVEQALAAVRRRMVDTPALRVHRGGAGAAAAGLASANGPRSAWQSVRRWRGPVLAAAAALTAIVVGLAPWKSRATDAAQVYATRVGQRDSVQLPDGSVIMLAPGSRLTVASDFNGTHREVALEGAAFFTVTHDDRRPFVVRTRGAEIRDLGTAFSVKSDASGAVSVAVTHGVVAMRDTMAGSAAPVELRAGDRGTLRAGTVAVARGTVTDDDVAWTRGQLAYRDASLAEVQADLRRWYGIELAVPDRVLAGRTLTASFHSDSASQVVRVIALALGAEVVQRGDTILLLPLSPSSTPKP
jgi:transmembrane sensor